MMVGSLIFPVLVCARRVVEGEYHLICFVVVLWVILEHFRFLSVIECLGEVVHAAAELLPPLLAVDKPGAPCQRPRSTFAQG